MSHLMMSARGRFDSESRHRRRLKVTIIVVIVITGLAVLIGAIVFAVLQSARKNPKVAPRPRSCNASETARCARADADCTLESGSATCVCRSRGKVFTSGSCVYRCDSDASAFCPDGVCYESRCFSDVLSFVKALYEERCSMDGPTCNVSCMEVLHHVCRSLGQPPFCLNPESVPAAYRRYACQLDEASDHPYGSTVRSIEPVHCVGDPVCTILKRFYPCLMDYARDGRVQCTRTCIVPEGVTLLSNGSCVAKSADCESAFATLIDALDNHELGYSYEDDDFYRLFHLVPYNLLNYPPLRILLYPITLAYASMVHRGAAPRLEYGAYGNVDEFIEQAKFHEQFAKLFPMKEKNFTEQLTELAANTSETDEGVLHEIAYMAALAANCSLQGDCTTTTGYHPTNASWIARIAPLCATTRALYFVKRLLDEDWYDVMADTLGARFPPMTLTLLYRPEFTSQLIESSRQIIKAGPLDKDIFRRSLLLCNRTDEPVNVRSHIVLSMTLYRRLEYDVDQLVQPGKVASFAVVLANTYSIRMAVCGEEPMPTVDCELRLYMAFASFMPERPTDAEIGLIGSDDPALVYFTLRGVVRLQTTNGVRRWSSEGRRETSIEDIRAAVRNVTDSCLRKLDTN